MKAKKCPSNLLIEMAIELYHIGYYITPNDLRSLSRKLQTSYDVLEKKLSKNHTILDRFPDNPRLK